MAKRKTYHVTKRSDGSWQGKSEGAKRASAVTRTKAEAVGTTRALAKKAELGQIVIHRADNRIQTEYTYGQDPHPPKG